MTITLPALQQQRRDTASNWASNNPTLLAGEWGYETDTKKFKIGDGTTAYTSLDYVPIPDTNRLLTGNLTVGGNFTVNGTTTTIDTTTLTVEDKNIEIGKVSSPSDTTADGGGLTLLGSSNKTFNWVNSTDSWTSSEHIALPDNKKLQLGDSQDLQIFHDGSQSVILDNGTGQLRISGENTIALTNADGTESYARFVANDTAQLFHDNAVKLSTTAIGVSVTGKLTTSGDIIINSDYPVLSFIDTSNDSDYRLTNANGNFLLYDISNAATRLTVTSAGLIKVHGNVEPNADNSTALGSSSKRFTTLHSAGINVTGDIVVSGNVDGRDIAADGTKLDGIEINATADQTAAEIRTLVESASDSNVFTDADHSKLNGIEASATADQTAAEIKTLVESATDSNVFTDADHTKLNGIEASATADQTAAEIRTLVESATDSNVFTDADHTKLNGIETGATADQTASEIVALVADQTIAPSTIDMEDDEIIKLGASDDFEIFHQSSNNNSIIRETGGGNLSIQTNGANLNFYDSANDATLASFITGGSAKLFHSGTKRFETLNSGANIVGNLTLTGTVDGVDIATRDTLFGGLTASSGVLSNGVTATTQGSSDNTTKVATTAYVTTAISNLINGAPSALDTLNELAAAMNDNASFSTTVTNNLATKMPLAGGEFTGNVTFSGSQTVDGRDLSVDGAKLDTIESNATADQTASEILTLLKTVDGSGSGLDADTLDGINSGSFIRSDTADTASGDITFSGGAGAVTIAANSDIRFVNGGTWSGNTTAGKIQLYNNVLYVSGGTAGIIFRENTANRWAIDGDGHFDPAVDSTYDIGQSDKRVRNGYFDTLYGDGSNLTGLTASNANTLDNLDSTQFLRSDADDVATKRIRFENCETDNEDTIATSSGSKGCIEIKNTGVGNDAFMAFHAGSDFAFYFGLDADTNDIAVGGWSMGANKYKIWHQNNDGSGSTLDADLLDGIEGSSYARTILTEDDITTRLNSGFYQTSTATTGEGWPETTNGWYHLITSTHHNTANYYALQIAGDFFTQDFYIRNVNNSGTTAWSNILTSSSSITATNVTGVANTGNTAYRVPFLSANTGTAAVYTDTNDGITYNPSTGELFSSKISVGNNLVTENNNSHASNFWLNTDAALLISNRSTAATAKSVLKLESEAAIVFGDGSGSLIISDRENERMRFYDDGQITIGSNSDIKSNDAAITSTLFESAARDQIGIQSVNNDHQNSRFNIAAYAKSYVSSGSEFRNCFMGLYKVGSNNPAGFINMAKRNGGNAYFWSDSSTRLRCATGVGSIGASQGTVVGTQSSDIRIKNNLGSVSYGLAEINKITPIKFTYKDDDSSKQEIGFSAQDVISIIPEAVYDTEDSREIDGETIENVLAMDYTSLIPVLVNAIKELSTEVNTLKSKIA